MSTNTERNPIPHPDHDAQAAGLYQAIALRFYSRYVDARHLAEFTGEDLPGAEPLLTQREAAERYRHAVDEWLHEPPDSIDAILALVEFAGVIAADHFASEVMRETAPVSAEIDALHQNIALSAVGSWLHEMAQREWLDRRIAVYGPSGMSAKERGGAA